MGTVSGKRVGQRLRLLVLATAVLLMDLEVHQAKGVSPPYNLRLVGQMGGGCDAVWAEGSYCYIGEGANLTVLDVSNPSAPAVIGRLSFGDFAVNDIEVKAGLAYVAGWAFAGPHGLQIVDVTNPRLPRLLGFFQTPFYALGVEVLGGLAYVACGSNLNGQDQGGFQILDVSNPALPVLRGSSIGSLVAMKVRVRNGIAYVVGVYGGLHIFDVSNPSQIKPLGVAPAGSLDVVLSGNIAYVADDGGCGVVDVSTPTAPVVGRRVYTGTQVVGLHLSGNLLYLAHPGIIRPNGLAVVNVANPSSPTLVGTCPTSGMASAVLVSSGTAYMASSNGGLSILDVRNPAHPTLRASYDTLSDASDVYVEGGVAYIANGVRGLKTIDVSNPSAPRLLGSLLTGGGVFRMAVSGKKAYLAEGNYWMDGPTGHAYVVDISSPASPRLLSSYHASWAPGIAVANGWAYLAEPLYGLQIVDVSNPTSPTLRGLYHTPDGPDDVFVSGGLAYVADYSSLQILDIRNPASPVFRASFQKSQLYGIVHAFVSNGVAYLDGVWGKAHFESVSVSNPSTPILLGTYDLSSGHTAADLDVRGRYAYLLLEGLRILDIRDPSVPRLCGYYPTVTEESGFPCGVFGAGDLVYVADPYGGLRIFRFTGYQTPADRWKMYK